MFTIEQLDAFTATEETGSFSAAARKLGKAQSVVSQHIINMELDCGVDLFDRSGRYPRLTGKGQELLPYAQASLSQFERLKNKASHLYSQEVSQIVLAVDEGVPIHRMSQLLSQLEKAYPMIQVEFLTATTRDAIELVATGRATTGLVISEQDLPSKIDFSTIGMIEFNIFAAQNHPILNSSIKHIDELKRFRQLVIGSKNSQLSSLSQVVSPDFWYADNYFVLLDMVKAGMGWSLLPNHIGEVESVRPVKVEGDISSLTWHANIDVIQHQKWSSDPLHQYARQLLTTLLD